MFTKNPNDVEKRERDVLEVRPPTIAGRLYSESWGCSADDCEQILKDMGQAGKQGQDSSGKRRFWEAFGVRD